MTDFKSNVMFYLKGISEEKEDDKVCPKCGKNPCKCSQASASTKTAGGDDGDDYTKNASVTDKEDKNASLNIPKDGYTPEERKILKLIISNLRSKVKDANFEDEVTPEEKEIINILKSRLGVKAAVVDDHTNGANGCVDTDASKKTEVCPVCGKNPCECKKHSLKESILGLV